MHRSYEATSAGSGGCGDDVCGDLAGAVGAGGASTLCCERRESCRSARRLRIDSGSSPLSAISVYLILSLRASGRRAGGAAAAATGEQCCQRKPAALRKPDQCFARGRRLHSLRPDDAGPPLPCRPKPPWMSVQLHRRCLRQPARLPKAPYWALPRLWWPAPLGRPRHRRPGLARSPNCPGAWQACLPWQVPRRVPHTEALLGRRCRPRRCRPCCAPGIA